MQFFYQGLIVKHLHYLKSWRELTLFSRGLGLVTVLLMIHNDRYSNFHCLCSHYYFPFHLMLRTNMNKNCMNEYFII